MSGSKRLDLRLGLSLSPLERMAAGLADGFGPVAVDPAAAGRGGAPPARSSVGTLPADGDNGAADEQAEGSLVHTFVGVGQAGWGCETEGAAVFRGSKWVAHAGVVLRVPDHVARTERQRRAAIQTVQAAGEVAKAANATGQGAEAAPAEALQQQQEQQQAAPTPLYLFHSHVLQLGAGAQEAALRALMRVDWGCFGFKLQGVAPSAKGPASLLLCCVQPDSGARMEALVVHLQPGDAAAEAAAGRAPPLTAASEGRAARGAVEAALRQLKAQCPAVVASRRERCLLRALPTLARAVGNIVQRSTTVDDEGSSLQAQACAMLGCGSEAFLDTLHSMLHQVANNAGVEGEADECSGGGSR